MSRSNQSRYVNSSGVEIIWDDENLKQNQSILANQRRESEMQGKCIYEGFRPRRRMIAIDVLMQDPV